MTIELLYFDGCPNHEAFLPHLRELLDRRGVTEQVRLRRVESAEDAERERFLGSPTLRVDGRDVDPGAAVRDDFGLKCRLYATPAGMTGTPADEWVIQALDAAQHERSEPPDLSFLSRSWAAQRVAALTVTQRKLHRHILRGFVDHGDPSREQLASWARRDGVDLDEALRALAANDLVHRHPESGQVAVAYPFSAAATAHRVRLENGREVFAMCALDALGIAFMIEAPTAVASHDPETSERVEVLVDPKGASSWTPREAVVVVGCASGGSSADCMCPHTNFAASVDSGQALLHAMAECSGTVRAMPEAIEVGRELFGSLLAEDLEVADA